MQNNGVDFWVSLSVEDPSLEEACGRSGGECLRCFAKVTLFNLPSITRQEPACNPADEQGISRREKAVQSLPLRDALSLYFWHDHQPFIIILPVDAGVNPTAQSY